MSHDWNNTSRICINMQFDSTHRYARVPLESDVSAAIIKTTNRLIYFNTSTLEIIILNRGAGGRMMDARILSCRYSCSEFCRFLLTPVHVLYVRTRADDATSGFRCHSVTYKNVRNDRWNLRAIGDFEIEHLSIIYANGLRAAPPPPLDPSVISWRP